MASLVLPALVMPPTIAYSVQWSNDVSAHVVRAWHGQLKILVLRLEPSSQPRLTSNSAKNRRRSGSDQISVHLDRANNLFRTKYLIRRKYLVVWSGLNKYLVNWPWPNIYCGPKTVSGTKILFGLNITLNIPRRKMKRTWKPVDKREAFVGSLNLNSVEHSCAGQAVIDLMSRALRA